MKLKNIIKNLLLFILVILLFVVSLLGSSWRDIKKNEALQNQYLVQPSQKFWHIQSIDTMKYSRDLARKKVWDPMFDQVIKSQMNDIANIGATHVAIDTPYDREFVPFLKKWVDAARQENLNVWFRGNMAGWEKWFDYHLISPDSHTKQVLAFIKENPGLFADGDVFSSCPECENGSIGDPRATNRVSEYRKFVIYEHNEINKAFLEIGVNVMANLNSMNGNIAEEIMDEDTVKDLGGIIAIDHYVREPNDLVKDLKKFTEKNLATVILGEFGAPLPGYNPDFSEKEQADWVDSALFDLLTNINLEGINYWVNMGGTTALWNDDGSPREVVKVLEKFYQPSYVYGFVQDELGEAVANVSVGGIEHGVVTDEKGYYQIANMFIRESELNFYIVGYFSKMVEIVSDKSQRIDIILEKENVDFWEKNRIKQYKKINSIIK